MRFFFLILISFLLLGTAAGPEAPLFRPGKDHALFIAVDNYQHWNDLQYPVKDVGRIAAELENGARAEATAGSKREAQQAAARALLDRVEQ